MQSEEPHKVVCPIYEVPTIKMGDNPTYQANFGEVEESKLTIQLLIRISR